MAKGGQSVVVCGDDRACTVDDDGGNDVGDDGVVCVVDIVVKCPFPPSSPSSRSCRLSSVLLELKTIFNREESTDFLPLFSSSSLLSLI